MKTGQSLSPLEVQQMFPHASKSTLEANGKPYAMAADVAKGKDEALVRRPATSPAPPAVKRKARAGKQAGTMNRTEAAFYALLLERKAAGEFVSVEYEAVTLKVGEPRCRYTADFACFTPEGRLWLFEVKGAHIWGDAAVKVRAAIRQYPAVHLEMWQKARKSEGGAWRQLL